MAGIRDALSASAEQVKHVKFAFDAICKKESSRTCASLLGPEWKLAHVLPLNEEFLLDRQKSASLVMVGDVRGDFGESSEVRDFGYVMMRFVC